MATARRLSTDSTSSHCSEPLAQNARKRMVQARRTLSPVSSQTEDSNHRPRVTPLNRFRSAVRNVIILNRLTANIGSVGGEPGIDPRRPLAQLEYSHIKRRCTIEITDYSSLRHTSRVMDNEQFLDLLKSGRREPWAKVRWINIGGLDWDVLSQLAITYEIHPLALEDMIHSRKHARSKADYYPTHLFIHALCHTLGAEHDQKLDLDSSNNFPSPIDPDQEAGAEWGLGNTRPQSVNGLPSLLKLKQILSWKHPGTARNVLSTIPPPSLPRATTFDVDLKSRKNAKNLKLIQELLRGQRVNAQVTPMFIFLFRNGTVVSVQHDQELCFARPIVARLQQQTSGLRATADASLLVQGLLDLVVDQAMEIVEEYQSKLLKIEQAVLVKPLTKHVVRLHALQEDLILHRRTLGPIKTLVYSLRRYDVDRVAAQADMRDPSEKPQGYMSHKARIYLADVHDHVEYILSSLDMFSRISDNLIEYTFNMSSYEMSEVMRHLTLATVIFLPLTVLAGYFGMNFNRMWTVKHGHSDVIFWIIALPMLAILLPIFLWSDLSRMKEGLEKRLAARSVKRRYKL